jgi:hypothetical protein
MFERGCFGHLGYGSVGSFGWYNEIVEGMCDGCERSGGVVTFAGDGEEIEVK